MSAPLGQSAFVCDERGILVEVLRDSLGFVAPEHVGSPVAARIADGSTAKWFGLLDAALHDRVDSEWEVDATVGPQIVTLCLAAVRSGDRVVVSATTPGRGREDLVEELAAINSEYANTLREVFKARQSQPRSLSGGGAVPWDQFSELYNDMASLQRELAKKNAALEALHGQKNELLGMFAHDLRTPLQGIAMACAVLETERDELTDRQARMVRQIVDSTRYLSDLVSDVLDLSAVESGKVQLEVEATDLVELIRRVAALHEVFAERKSIAFRFELPERIVGEVDGGKVEQVVANLLSNAIKYAPPGSAVTLSAESDDERAAFAVTDEGPGIPPERRQSLFHPFGTTGNRTTGGEKSTGLGLAIAKRIVEVHGGRITVESIGAGSRFEVELPLRPAG